MVVREILTRLGFKVDEKKLAGWNKRTARAKQLMRSAASGARSMAKAVAGVTVVAAAGATAIYKLVKSVADVGDQAAKDAKKLSLTAEAVQELDYAAKLSGANFTTVKIGLQALARGLNDAVTKGTGPAAEAFEQLGIALDDPAIKSKDLNRILPMLADKFKDMKGGTDKTALAMKLFSRSGAELIPLLNEGADGLAKMRQEARDLGLVISNEDSAAAEKFNDDLERLKSVIAGVRNSIGSELMPVLNEYVNDAREWLHTNRDLIAQRVREWIDKVVAGIKRVLPAAKAFASLLGSITTAAVSMIEALGPTGAVGALIALKAATVAAIGPWGLLAAAVIAASAVIGRVLADTAGGVQNMRFEIIELGAELSRLQRNKALYKRREELAERQAGALEILQEQAGELSEEEFERLAYQVADAAVRAGRSEGVGALIGEIRGRRKDFLARKAKEEKKAAKKAARRAGGGRAAKAKPDAELTAEQILERDFGDGGKMTGGPGTGGFGARAQQGALGTTINHFVYSPSLSQQIKVEQRPGESPTQFAERLVDIAREVFERENRAAYDHFQGAAA